MDFFRSILSDDPEPETLDNYEESDTESRQIQSPKHHETEGDEDDDSNSNFYSSEDGSSVGTVGGVWSFGDLVKTLTTKSESVFETYRRDLKEFGTGLKKESDLFREVASRAVKELPSSIEVGTSAIDGVLKSTAEIIAKGKEALLASSDVDDSGASDKRTYSDRNYLNSRGYSRFESQLNSIQNDTRTYCEDPEDLDDYIKWKLGFMVGEKRDEIEKLVGDDGDLAEMYAKIVPNEVNDATFWFRYFYKVHKLKQQEDTRAELVKRSLSVDDDEELSWDVDDDDEEQKQQQKQQTDQLESNTLKVDESKSQGSKVADENSDSTTNVVSVDKNNIQDPKLDEKVDPKVDSGKEIDSNVTAKSSQTSSQEEEDLEWDEIEDLGDNDDCKVSLGITTNKVDLHKRLTTAIDDEDLSWDIEDDDEDDDDDDGEPLKSGNK